MSGRCSRWGTELDSEHEGHGNFPPRAVRGWRMEITEGNFEASGLGASAHLASGLADCRPGLDIEGRSRTGSGSTGGRFSPNGLAVPDRGPRMRPRGKEG